MNTYSDSDLVGRIARRERQAFDLLYDRYAQIIFNLCARILRDTTDSEDVLQEVFVQIWKEAERFDASRASVKTWMFTIARSRALDRYRSRKNTRQRIEDDATEQLHQLSDGQDLQGTSVMQQFVSGALQQLSNEQRLVLELSYFEGLTQEEIAERLKEPLGTIKSRIRAGLLKLRSILSGEKSNV
jgi:RNA polymerase sigma-70 factor, ECF subfamily